MGPAAPRDPADRHVPRTVRPVLTAVLTAVLAAVPGGVVPGLPTALAAQGPVSGTPLRLGPGDALRLVVEREPELAGEYPVGTDGTVILPLAGEVEVAGRDFEEVERDVRAGLGRELAAGLAVQVVPLFRVAVLGEVRMPGVHLVEPSLTLSDVVAMSGGYTPLADRDDIRLVREGRTLLETEAELLGAGGPPLRSGDRVLVGRKGWFRENLGVVIGAVGSLTVAIVTGLIVR